MPTHRRSITISLLILTLTPGCTAIRGLSLSQQARNLGPVPTDEYDLEVTRCELNTETLEGTFSDVPPGGMLLADALITNRSDRWRRFEVRPVVQPLDEGAAPRPQNRLDTAPIPPGGSYVYSFQEWRLDSETAGYDCQFEIWESYTDLHTPPDPADR